MAMANMNLIRCICDKVMACTSVGVRAAAARRRRRRRNQNHNITEIFKFRGYNYIYHNIITVSPASIRALHLVS